MPLKGVALCYARARTKNYAQCSQPAMGNGLCRMHFGKGIGPKTTAGSNKRATSNLKHGQYTKDAIEERKQFRELVKYYKDPKLTAY